MTDTPPTGAQQPSHTFLIEILRRAVHAPSGDNSQPWRFRLDEGAIVLFNLPNADATLYNFRQRGSYFAHGAIIENLSILAAEQGYRCDVELFPNIPDATARISFTAAAPVAVPLAHAIEQRATNRKPYKQVPLEASHRAALLDAAKDMRDVELRFAEGKDALALLSRAVSVNERLLMENRTLHDFLFGMIRWSRKEERAKPGLYLKTMEFPPPVQFLMRFVLRYWSAVRLLNRVGLSRLIPVQSAASYRAAALFGAVVLTGDTNVDFVSAGRAFQRVWLTATALGVSVQPVTAIPYLMQRVVAGEATAFSSKHQDMIREANSVIRGVFRLRENEHIAMLFRAGYGDGPSATSSKAPPVFLEA